MRAADPATKGPSVEGANRGSAGLGPPTGEPAAVQRHSARVHKPPPQPLVTELQAKCTEMAVIAERKTRNGAIHLHQFASSCPTHELDDAVTSLKALHVVIVAAEDGSCVARQRVPERLDIGVVPVRSCTVARPMPEGDPAGAELLPGQLRLQPRRLRGVRVGADLRVETE